MKRFAAYILGMVLCVSWAAALPLEGNDRRSSRSVRFTVPSNQIKVSSWLIRAPEIGSVSRSKRGGVRFAEQWLQVNIQFSFDLSSLRGRTLVFLNRPVVELYMCNFRPGRRWFMGVQRIHSILLSSRHKNKKYNVSLFLPPNYVYAYIPRDKSDKTDVRSLAGVVVIRNEQGQILGRKVFSLRNKGVSSRDAAAMLRQLNDLRSRNNIAQFFWPREKTPWEWVDSENYELPFTELSRGKSPGTSNREE